MPGTSPAGVMLKVVVAGERDGRLGNAVDDGNDGAGGEVAGQ